METKYVNPEYNKDSFNCPYCGVLTHQFWSPLRWFYPKPGHGDQALELYHYKVSHCFTCKNFSFWHNGETGWEMIYPIIQFNFPEPNQDLSDDIKRDYFEAGKIVKDSPRGTAALLRLCVEKLVDQLVPGEGNINNKIGKLVKNGLETEIQEALDLARVIGNEAIHPGKLDLKDDQETAQLLFVTINLIAEKLLSRPNKISKAYKKLPPGKLEAIKERDKK